MIQARRIAIFLIFVSMTVLAERTRLKPATSGPPQDDIKMGLGAATEAEKQLVLIKNPEVTAYISSLGSSLVAKAPNDNKFPFTFKIVDDKSINAFALPGGPIYVNRGAIEAADNEAQIAGVIGHEAGHVILRHGMAQAKKSQLTQVFVGGARRHFRKQHCRSARRCGRRICRQFDTVALFTRCRIPGRSHGHADIVRHWI